MRKIFSNLVCFSESPNFTLFISPKVELVVYRKITWSLFLTVEYNYNQASAKGLAKNVKYPIAIQIAIDRYVLDVLWCQPIKLIQVVSTS